MENNFHIKYFDRVKNQIIEMPLEELVGILLPLEINIDFHMEALKAQAVILRTNLLRASRALGGEGDISLDINKENYHTNIKKINKAVEETRGLTITFRDKLIDAKYHLVCGGSTENAENVIENQVIYLRRVLCQYCKDSPYWEGEKSFSLEEIQRALEVQFPEEDISVNTQILKFVEEIEKDQHGRVLSIKIGDKVFQGKELMEVLDLYSTRFSLFPTGIKFVSRGRGHGLGLCQYGANKMAQEGYTFMEILKYYYTGVDIQDFGLPCIKKPLFGKILVVDPGHGGDDYGHKGDHLNLLEKDIVLKLSIDLKTKLEEKGAIVHLTRNRDENVIATDRIKKANKIYPDFYISIHMDYYPNSTLKGCEVFHFRDDKASHRLGLSILKNMDRLEIPTRGIKEGNFYVFRGVNVSSLLIEIGYLSNVHEEVKFTDEDYLGKLVEGILSGILEYYEE